MREIKNNEGTVKNKGQQRETEKEGVLLLSSP